MNMRQSRALRQMRAGKVATCVKLNLSEPRNAEIAAMCGFDCIWIDLEHVPNNMSCVEETVRAAKICLEGYTLSTGILYFVNPTKAPNSWASRNRTYFARIGNPAFYY